MAVKRLLILAMLVSCNARAADFGDIPANLALPASQSVRRNAGDTAFEAYTPGTGGGGSFLSANIARVDPSGNDGTGTVGDLNKPFLTVQAAIDAIEAGSFVNPVVDIGANNYSADVTTTLSRISFVGAGSWNSNDESSNSAFQSLTFSGHTLYNLFLFNVGVGGDQDRQNIAADANTQIFLGAGGSVNDVTLSSGKSVNIQGQGVKYNQVVTGTVTATGGVQLQDSKVNNVVAGSSAVTMLNCLLNVLTSASSAGLTDSRIITNNAGVTPTYDDFYLKLAGTNTPLGDPNANRFIGWDDTDNLAAYFTIGGGLTYTHSTHTVSVSTPTPTATATPTATPTATATATATPTPSATATAYPQGFTAHFSRGGAAIQANDVTITPWTTKYPGTITGFIISSDQGTCTLKVWKKATGTAIPTIADVINTSGVSLATGTHIDSATVTDFTTTTVSIGDQFMAQITAVSGATDITFQIPIRQ